MGLRCEDRVPVKQGIQNSPDGMGNGPAVVVETLDLRVPCENLRLVDLDRDELISFREWLGLERDSEVNFSRCSFTKEPQKAVIAKDLIRLRPLRCCHGAWSSMAVHMRLDHRPSLLRDKAREPGSPCLR